MAPPRLPPELIADLIELTVELLIEEERHLEAHAPLSNRFLLSAALVDRTWHAIATPVLLKRGIVTSGSVAAFLGQVMAHGMQDTLESVRFGEAASGVTAQGAVEEDIAFDLLFEILSGLDTIELVDSGAYFQTALPPGRITQTVHLSNHKLLLGGFGRKFEHRPPNHLVVTETRNTSLELDPDTDTTTPLLRSVKVLQSVQSLSITMNQGSGAFYVGMLMMIGALSAHVPPHLQTCRLEITTVESFREALASTHVGIYQRLVYNYPHLQRLAAHLLFAYLLVGRGTHPCLTLLEILDDPPGVYVDENVGKVLEPNFLEVVANLPVLASLKTPACWASDALREACEAKGVTLLSF
ncbi:hypothetical protein RQP46_006115 [Phenoliferia psychrophenolica]